MFRFLSKVEENIFWGNFEKYYSKLIYFNIRKLFNEYNYSFQEVDVEDCYGEVILKIYSNKEKIFGEYNENKSKFSTYLTVICYNKIKDYLSSMKYKYKQTSDDKLDFFNYHSEMNMEDILQVQEIFEKILNQEEQLIMKLFYFEELRSYEIGDILGINESTVRVKKKQIIDKIKRSYDV